MAERNGIGVKEVGLGVFIVLLLGSASLLTFGSSISSDNSSERISISDDPLFQGEDHDHSNASQHIAGTDNMALMDYNSLTTTGNAEIQVATTPDGETYAYLAGWNDMHIVDVTNPNNTTVTGVYNDPNTQVLDVKYVEYNGREYILQQEAQQDALAEDDSENSPPPSNQSGSDELPKLESLRSTQYSAICMRRYKKIPST